MKNYINSSQVLNISSKSSSFYLFEVSSTFLHFGPDKMGQVLNIDGVVSERPFRVAKSRFAGKFGLGQDGGRRSARGPWRNEKMTGDDSVHI